MSLDQRPPDTELLRRAESGTSDGRRVVNGIELGPDSPLLKAKQVVVAKAKGGGKTYEAELARQARALDVLDPRGEMNSWERMRAQELEATRAAGHLRSWKFDDVILRLANNTRYRPDFMLVYAETHGIRVVFEEVKGHWRDDARVKIKVAATLYPQFEFRALRRRRKKDGGGWQVEVIKP